MNIPTESLDKWRDTSWNIYPMPDQSDDRLMWIAQRAAEWALSQPVSMEPVAHIRKDQLQKAAVMAALREVTPAPRQDRIGIYTAYQLQAAYNAGLDAGIARLYEMHRVASGRHNFYGHAALELAKLKKTK